MLFRRCGLLGCEVGADWGVGSLRFQWITDKSPQEIYTLYKKRWQIEIFYDYFKNRLQKAYVNNHIEKKRIRNRGELPQYYATETHPAIIDQETFDAAQDALARIAASHASGKPAERHAFTGMIVCLNCGKHFKRVKNHGLSRWACPTFIQEGKEFCHCRKIPEEVLMRITAELFGWNEFDEEAFKGAVDRITAIYPNQLVFHLKDGTERKTEWQSGAMLCLAPTLFSVVTRCWAILCQISRAVL